MNRAAANHASRCVRRHRRRIRLGSVLLLLLLLVDSDSLLRPRNGDKSSNAASQWNYAVTASAAAEGEVASPASKHKDHPPHGRWACPHAWSPCRSRTTAECTQSLLSVVTGRRFVGPFVDRRPTQVEAVLIMHLLCRRSRRHHFDVRCLRLATGCHTTRLGGTNANRVRFILGQDPSTWGTGISRLPMPAGRFAIGIGCSAGSPVYIRARRLAKNADDAEAGGRQGPEGTGSAQHKGATINDGWWWRRLEIIRVPAVTLELVLRHGNDQNDIITID